MARMSGDRGVSCHAPGSHSGSCPTNCVMKVKGELYESHFVSLADSWDPGPIFNIFREKISILIKGLPHMIFTENDFFFHFC